MNRATIRSTNSRSPSRSCRQLALVRSATDQRPLALDRLFRNLLTDFSGNTHRAEFSIDKLYSPDGAAGRLGLVEMRAFEMPPHARMSLAQHLLLRALVGNSGSIPTERPRPLGHRYSRPLDAAAFLRDGFQGCDRTTCATRDTRSSSNGSRRTLSSGFRASATFRSATCMSNSVSALEPWHVLGEDNAPGGAVRYVDSSLERLQVKVAGMVNDSPSA